MCRMAATEVAQIEDQWRKHLGDKAFKGMRDALISLRNITDPYR